MGSFCKSYASCRRLWRGLFLLTRGAVHQVRPVTSPGISTSNYTRQRWKAVSSKTGIVRGAQSLKGWSGLRQSLRGLRWFFWASPLSYEEYPMKAPWCLRTPSQQSAAKTNHSLLAEFWPNVKLLPRWLETWIPVSSGHRILQYCPKQHLFCWDIISWRMGEHRKCVLLFYSSGLLGVCVRARAAWVGASCHSDFKPTAVDTTWDSQAEIQLWFIIWPVPTILNPGFVAPKPQLAECPAFGHHNKLTVETNHGQ